MDTDANDRSQVNASDDRAMIAPDIDHAQVVATTSSPSDNTQLTLDISDSVKSSRLVGALVGLDWFQRNLSVAGADGGAAAQTAVLGQITSITLRNRWHEDTTFKNIVKSRGGLPAITEVQDTRTATMKVGGCFERDGASTYKHADLGGVPATGIEVKEVRQRFLDSVLKSCANDLFYLGQDYAGNINFPMWFKHFDNGPGGVGEAYHIGVFGKTGSGKTGLAKMLLAAYARHHGMGLLVLDPQGEFTFELQGQEVGAQGLNLRALIEKTLDRAVDTISLDQLQLDDKSLFEELLDATKLFRTEFGISGEENLMMATRLTMRWIAKHEMLGQLSTQSEAKQYLRYLKDEDNARRIYRTKALRDELVGRIEEHETGERFEEFYSQTWAPITQLFASSGDKWRIRDIVERLIDTESVDKSLVVLDLSKPSGNAVLDEAVQKRIISHVANQIVDRSALTLGTGATANTLVILDEAHRFAPSGRSGDMTQEDWNLRAELKRAVRETRKYGVGWMFISQTMMGLDTELLMQLRTMFFGYGLAFGLEFQRLRELAGGDADAMNLYRSFRDPQSAMDAESKRFPFMAIGPISPMPFSGQPMFFSAFNGADFMEANRDAFKRAARPRDGRTDAESANDGSPRDGGNHSANAPVDWQRRPGAAASAGAAPTDGRRGSRPTQHGASPRRS